MSDIHEEFLENDTPPNFRSKLCMLIFVSPENSLNKKKFTCFIDTWLINLKNMLKPLIGAK